jgi:Protein of unknown function (DUF2924)
MRTPPKATRPRTALPPTASGPLDRSRVAAEIEALERLGVDELRLQWRNRWGRLAPARLSRSLLYRVMVYRIQAEAFGDLDRETKRMLDRLADYAPADPSMVGASTAEPTGRASAPASSSIGNVVPLVLKPGALLTREWQGRIERVMVLEEGFAWNGKTHASVSAVAFAITGIDGRCFYGGADRAGFRARLFVHRQCCAAGLEARRVVDPRVAGPDRARHGSRRGLCLERQDPCERVGGSLRDHGRKVERTKVLLWSGRSGQWRRKWAQAESRYPEYGKSTWGSG